MFDVVATQTLHETSVPYCFFLYYCISEAHVGVVECFVVTE